ncbi:RNA polymerase subunit sigma-70, partial [Dehalococcoidia bacterium]|nr:RNA polymerase subunit sigma-70 [Dehalococcoidia bacterium]
MQDEQNLVHRAQQGDQEAFAQLYESHFEDIYRYVTLRVRNRIEAEDITQEVFLKAVRSIQSFKWKGIPFSA